MAWCDSDQVLCPTRLEALEAMAFEGGRWWPLDELLASADAVLPVVLRDHLSPLVVGELPAQPIDLGRA